MNDTITHFMWGHQRHFRRSVEFEVETALREIGAGVGPTVLLVGFRANANAAFDYCIEPEDGAIATVDLSHVLDRAGELFDANEESRIFHTHAGLHAQRQGMLRDQARCEALCETLSASEAGAGRTYFASRSQPIGSDSLSWPRRDGSGWPHLVGVSGGVTVWSGPTPRQRDGHGDSRAGGGVRDGVSGGVVRGDPPGCPG